MAKVMNSNYITVQGWMVNDLHLKGTELLVYATIFGFSQTEGQRYTGSLQYLARCYQKKRTDGLKKPYRKGVHSQRRQVYK